MGSTTNPSDIGATNKGVDGSPRRPIISGKAEALPTTKGCPLRETRLALGPSVALVAVMWYLRRFQGNLWTKKSDH